MKHRATIGFVVLTVFITLGVMQAAAGEKVLKIGVLGPFTGASAKIGAEMKLGAEMAFANIGNKVGDYRIELVWIDSQGDPAKATNAYAEAIEKGGIEAGILNWSSSEGVAIMDVVAKYKIPHLFGLAATGIITEKYRSDPQKYGYYTAKLWPVPSTQSQGFVDLLNHSIQTGRWKPDNKVAAIFGEDTDWGRSVGEGFKKSFTDTGWKLASQDYFDRTQTDFYPLMSRYKSAGVTVIAGTTNQPDQISAFVKQAREVGVKAVIAAYGLGWVGDWYKLVGPASDLVLDASPDLATPEAKKWGEAFKQKYGSTPGAASAGIPYDGANFFIKVLRRGLEKYGKLDREVIYKIAREEVDTGKLTYCAKDGALVNRCYRYTAQTAPDPVYGLDDYYFPIFQYAEGKARLVWPEAIKTGEFAIPKN